MNVFVSRDLHYTDLVILRFLEDFKNLKLNTNITLLTTDREQDKPFISFALMKGLNFKVYSVRDFSTDEVARKISSNIDFLILYSHMSNTFYRSLYKHCSKNVLIGNKKHNYNDVKSALTEKYENKIESMKNDKRRKTPIIIDEYGLYKSEVLDVLDSLQLVPIRIINSMEV